MARRDYICCKSCGCKLVYDGYDNIRDGLEAQYGTMDLICPDCLKELETKLAEREQEPAQAVPVAWKHDCAALLTNDVELWVDHCPHCGKPRTTHPAPLDSDTRKMVLELCDTIITGSIFGIITKAKKIRERLEAGE